MEIAEVYLRPLLDWGIDTLVMGCTHYPILRATIRSVVGDGVRIVDSAETTAHAVAAALEGRLATDAALEPRYRFLVTDAAERFRRIAGEFLDHDVDHLELVDLVW
jgi:glutamate racemase